MNQIFTLKTYLGSLGFEELIDGDVLNRNNLFSASRICFVVPLSVGIKNNEVILVKSGSGVYQTTISVICHEILCLYVYHNAFKRERKGISFSVPTCKLSYIVRMVLLS